MLLRCFTSANLIPWCQLFQVPFLTIFLKHNLSFLLLFWGPFMKVFNNIKFIILLSKFNCLGRFDKLFVISFGVYYVADETICFFKLRVKVFVLKLHHFWGLFFRWWTYCNVFIRRYVSWCKDRATTFCLGQLYQQVFLLIWGIFNFNQIQFGYRSCRNRTLFGRFRYFYIS